MIIKERRGCANSENGLSYMIELPDGTPLFECSFRPTERECELMYDAFYRGKEVEKSKIRSHLRAIFGFNEPGNTSQMERRNA